METEKRVSTHAEEGAPAREGERFTSGIIGNATIKHVER
jgi:hypothetical protein